MTNSQFHSYAFLSVEKNIHSVKPNDLQAYKKAFLKRITKDENVITYMYATVGFKADTSILLWFHSDSPDHTQNLLNDLLHTKLGSHLTINYTLFGIMQDSVYRSKPTANNESLDDKLRLPYLVIYPFTKTKEWYALDLEKRKSLMGEHMKVGFQYTQIRQLLLYSFGVDDHEFVVSYETDSLADFQSLVMALRSTEARLYTKNDTPIFTCIYKPIEAALDFI